MRQIEINQTIIIKLLYLTPHWKCYLNCYLKDDRETTRQVGVFASFSSAHSSSTPHSNNDKMVRNAILDVIYQRGCLLDVSQQE